MNEKEICNILIKELLSMGFVVHKYHAITTQSIYIKLDYGVCCGIRISNHNGKKKYHYRFNVIKEYSGDKITYFENLVSYFFTFEELPQLLQQIQKEKCNKIRKYGLKKYKQIIEQEKSNDLFTRFKQVKGEN